MDFRQWAEFLAVLVVQDNVAAGPLQNHRHRRELDLALGTELEPALALEPVSGRDSVSEPLRDQSPALVLNFRQRLFAICLGCSSVLWRFDYWTSVLPTDEARNPAIVLRLKNRAVALPY